MERMIIKHLTGSKANQVEEFALRYHDELVFGRDPSATVKYDPDRDDLVGRQHARISRDPNDAEGFIVADLSSRNGTFVNKHRILGLAKLQPGDTVQLGPNGPEFVFDVEPRPSNAIRQTRLAEVGAASGSGVTPATRVVNTGAAASGTAAMSGASNGKSSVGKATVERMISHSVTETKKKEGRKYAVIGAIAGVVILLLFAAGIGGSYWYNSRQQAALQAELAQKEAEAKIRDEEARRLSSQQAADIQNQMATAAAMAPKAAAEIAEKHGKAVVQIRNVWRLVNTASNSQMYHQYLPNSLEVLGRIYGANLGKGKIFDTPHSSVPIYFALTPDGRRYEPVLTDEKNDYSVPIGDSGDGWGSGFIVTTDGYILTNRHVAAPWKAIYSLGDANTAPPGIVMDPQTKKIVKLGVAPPQDWIPDNTKSVPPQFKDKFEAESKIYVQLPNTENLIAAQFIQVSPRHDVGMLKLSVPGNLPKVELYDASKTLKKGDGLVVMGYPGTAPTVKKLILSQDMLNQEPKTVEIPDPTVTVTAVGNIVQNRMENLTDLRQSDMSDLIRYAGGLTFGGNSGGPVFDMQGRVIALHFMGDGRSGGNFSGGAVPIKYGMELFPGGQ